MLPRLIRKSTLRAPFRLLFLNWFEGIKSYDQVYLDFAVLLTLRIWLKDVYCHSTVRRECVVLFCLCGLNLSRRSPFSVSLCPAEYKELVAWCKQHSPQLVGKMTQNLQSGNFKRKLALKPGPPKRGFRMTRLPKIVNHFMKYYPDNCRKPIGRHFLWNCTLSTFSRLSLPHSGKKRF